MSKLSIIKQERAQCIEGKLEKIRKSRSNLLKSLERIEEDLLWFEEAEKELIKKSKTCK